MLGEQAIIPNFTSYQTPTPNPNPNPNSIPFLTDASQHPSSHVLQDPSAFELLGAAATISGTISQTSDSTAIGQVGVTMSEAANDVLVTRQLGSILPFQCEVCNISCNTKDVLEKHKQGKKHLRSVKKIADSSDNAPNMASLPVASGTLVEELENKKHRLLQNGATAGTLIYCDICNVICNGQEVFQKHVASKKHNAKSIIQRASTNAVFDGTSDSSSSSEKKPEPFQCEICKITCTSSELLKKHTAGKKHLLKLRDSGKIPNLPLTSTTSQDTTPTAEDKTVNPESNEGKTVSLHGAKPMCELCGITCDTNEVFENHLKGKKHLKKMNESGQIPNLPLTPIASEDTPPTNPMVKTESNEGKTVNLHEAKAVCELCGISCDTNEMLKIHISGRKHRKNVERSEKLIGPSPAPTTEPEPKPKQKPEVIGPLQEDVKMVSSDGNKRKAKGPGSGDDLETKKQKVLQNGTALDAVLSCNLCNVVCNSRMVFISHLAGQKHAAMVAKQAETQQAETQQAETQQAETQQAETQQAETQQAETQQAETQQAETQTKAVGQES